MERDADSAAAARFDLDVELMVVRGFGGVGEFEDEG